MPQGTLFEGPTYRLVIELEDTTMDLVDGIKVTVKTAAQGGELGTIWVRQLESVETDYLDTLVQAATHAFLYTDGKRTIGKACEGVMKHARRHKRDWLSRKGL